MSPITTTMSLLSLALFPLYASCASFQDTISEFQVPETNDPVKCYPAPNLPKTSDVRQVAKYLKSNLQVQQIKNLYDRQCTIVASQHEAAVYICNTSGKDKANGCPASVTGDDVATAIYKIIGHTGCSSGGGVGEKYTVGSAWLGFDDSLPPGCAQEDASFITLVGSS